MHDTPWPGSSVLLDQHGRLHDVLRLSVTDRCNLRCAYCMPGDHYDFTPRADLLSVEEIGWLVALCAAHGVRRVRLTGGEPLLRKELCAIVETIAAIPGVEDLSLTTNGMLLARHADALAAAGLQRVNVSLDTLDEAQLRDLTRHGAMAQIRAGLEAAQRVGLEPIKLNALIMRGINDGEIPAWLELLRTQPLTVRLMELMPIGEQDARLRDRRFDLSALARELERTIGLRPVAPAHQGNGPATYWRAPGWRGTLGLITPMSNPYCDTCRRLRISCRGELFACLADTFSVNLRAAIQRRDARAVLGGLHIALGSKPRGHRWREHQRTAHGMSTLGG